MKKYLLIVSMMLPVTGSLLVAQNSQWIFYNASNSGLNYNDDINCIELDNSGNKWLGLMENRDIPTSCVLTFVTRSRRVLDGYDAK